MGRFIPPVSPEFIESTAGIQSLRSGREEKRKFEPRPCAAVAAFEERKHAILFAATLLCARRLIETINSDKPDMAKQYFVDKAIQEAEFILERIHKRWPVEAVSEQGP